MKGLVIRKWLWVAALVSVGAIVMEQRGCTPSISDKPVGGTYFYEQREGDPPRAVLTAIDKINAKDIIADTADIDALNESGAVPEQYKLTLPEAKKVGPPAWVTRSKTRALKVVKNPQTEEEILETAP